MQQWMPCASHEERRDERRHEQVGSRHRADDVPTRRDLPAAIAFFARVPVVTESDRPPPLEPRAERLLAWVDGERSVDAVVGACALPTEEALETLEELRLRGIIALR